MNIINPKILCVDDEATVLEALETFLLPSGYEVIKAYNGQEALEKLKDERVDLVLMDVKMPKLDGLEVCRRIKGDERLMNIPIVLITGLTSKEDRIKGIEAGAEDFISKPFDIAEVLARVKMLLKVKVFQEKRIGELLIEMGFITEAQLQDALTLSKEQKIKVGEALNSMGALDKDHIYWVLSNQLNMNYIELSPEMIDRELIKQFSLEVLEQLLCLPLYETAGEIHWAIADPTNYQVVKEVKSLRPLKSVQLHLALPEKIVDVLNVLKKEPHFPLPYSLTLSPEKKIDQPIIPLTSYYYAPSDLEFHWNNFMTFLLTMPPSEICWLAEDPQECRLIFPKDMGYETIHRYPREVFFAMKERLKQNLSLRHSQGEIRLFLRQKSTLRQGGFKLWPISGLGWEMIQISRIPDFSHSKFIKAHPKIPALMKHLHQLFHENGRLIMGGKEKLLIKQVFYSLLDSNELLNDFPPAFLLEGEMEMYFPKAAQLGNEEIDLIRFLDRFPRGSTPCVFYEAHIPQSIKDKETFSNIFSGGYTNIFLYFPFTSREEMQMAFAEQQDWRRAGFKAVFFQSYQLTFI